MPCLSEIGERGFIRLLRGMLPGRGDVAVGAGDDCAVVGFTDADDLVLKSDPVAEGVHFTAGTEPALIGRKALARVLSDFAAMGASPRWALVDFTAPGGTPVDVALGVYGGMAALAREHGVAIVGGDTSCGPAVGLHVFCAGVVPRGAALLRCAAKPGEAVYVTGELGGSFESGRHLSFKPRLAEGAWLRTHGASACIDVSDGAASELRHIAEESGVAVELDLAALPFSQESLASPDRIRKALTDGEDFELIFTAPDSADFRAAFRAAFPETRLSRIGVVRAGPAGVNIPPSCDGYDHFGS